MLVNTPSILAAQLLTFLAMSSTTLAERVKLNFYTDYLCKNYQASLTYDWADQMGSGGTNCWNWKYGNSMLVAECPNHGWCMCLHYFNENCSGDYASTIWNKPKAANCVGAAQRFGSFRCYYYG